MPDAAGRATLGGMETTSRTAAQLVAEARQRIENLTPDQLSAELSRGDVLLVDLREPDELSQSGSIPAAAHAARGMLEFYADPTSPYHRDGFDPGRRTILFCASGGRSALAAAALRDLGYTNVAHLDGGIKRWIAEGHQVVSSA